MLYKQCNIFCDDEHDVHYLGRIINEEAVSTDEFLFNAGRKCCGCGATGVPHIGFGAPCYASNSGSHYFTEKTAQLNK